VIFANWASAVRGDIGHAGIVIEVRQKNLLIAQHTTNKLDTLKDWMDGHDSGGSTYIWIVKPNAG